MRPFNVPDGPPASVLMGLWDTAMREYGKLGFEKHEEYLASENKCAMGDTFNPGAEVASGPSQDDCERWLSELNALKAERRALVGSSLDLLEEQLSWEQERAKDHCDHAREMADHYQKSAAAQAEIHQLTGAYGDFAKHEADQAADWQHQADRDCETVDDIGRHLDQVRADIEGRPERIAELDAAIAAAEAKVAECGLIE